MLKGRVCTGCSWVAGLLTALCLVGCLRPTAPSVGHFPLAEHPTIVIILRHAERLSDDRDTPLSEAGKARAQALVPMLTALKPDVVFVSELQRTRQTVAPFLEQTQRVALVRANEKSADLAAEILHAWRGRTVLVAWHRGPNVDLAKALGVVELPPQWGHDTYDRYWVVTIAADNTATLVEKIQPKF